MLARAPLAPLYVLGFAIGVGIGLAWDALELAAGVMRRH